MPDRTDSKNKSRKNSPFVFGAFASPAEIRAGAQEFFLLEVQRVTPEPLVALRNEVYPKYVAAFNLEIAAGASAEDLKKYACRALVNVMFAQQKEGTRELREFQEWQAAAKMFSAATDELVSWMKRFNLQGQRRDLGETPEHSDSTRYLQNQELWPIVAALETILDWHFSPTGSFRLRPTPPLWRLPIGVLKGLPEEPEMLPPIGLRAPMCRFPRLVPADAAGVEQAAWHIGIESEGHFRSRLRYCFEWWLNQYVDAKKSAAEKAGLRKVPGNRELDHFAWTVKFQIEQISIAKIAKTVGKHEKTVEDAIDGVLALICLEKRRAIRGPQRPERATSPHDPASD